MAARAPPQLLGRAEERQLLDRLLNDVRDGRSAVAVIRGEAGVGKTALLHYCAGQASGFRIAQIAGVEAEMELPFAGAAPAVRADVRPARRASRAAAGRPERRIRAGVGGRAGPFPGGPRCAEPAVGGRGGAAAAVSRRRRAVARRRLRPGPRIRRATAAGGVGGDRVRRSRAGRRRTSSTGCRSCTLEGLGDGDARALLARPCPGRLDDRVRDRIVAETRGNPLALLELPRGMSAAELAGGFEPPARGRRCPAASRSTTCGGSARCPRRRSG